MLNRVSFVVCEKKSTAIKRMPWAIKITPCTRLIGNTYKSGYIGFENIKEYNLFWDKHRIKA